MIFFISISALVFLLTHLFFYNHYWKRRNLPPGPTPWPLLGNIWHLKNSSTPYEVLHKWHREFGPIFTYWLAELPIICVSDYSLIQEAFVKQGDATAGRYNFKEITDLFRGGSYGIVNTDGELWKEQRKFTLHILREFGMGKNLMQEKILDEITHLLESLEENQDQEIFIADHFDVCVGSIISSLLFGFRYDQDRLKEYRSLKEMLASHMRMAGNPLSGLLFLKTSFFKHFPVLSDIYKEIISNRDTMFNYFDKQINEHLEEIKQTKQDGVFNLDDEPTDFIYAYLREIERRKIEKNYEQSFLQETTSLTLTWTILFVLHHPEVQEKIHLELDVLKAKSNSTKELIGLDAKTKLPYLCAVINESQRMTNLLPSNILHETTKDMVINGYTIPKESCIVPQISCVLYDERIFPDPHSFKPERFLDEIGQPKKLEQLIPFGVGKRACIGENLAKMELFLVLANLYNFAQILPIDEQNLPSLDKIKGLTVQPHSFNCRIVKRSLKNIF